MNTDRLFGVILGLLAGMFLCCVCAGMMLAVGGGAPASPSAKAPPGATLEAAIDETYLSRTLAQSAQGYPSPWKILSGRMDVKPGNQASFDVLLESPLGPTLVSGRLTFGVEQGRLIIHVVQVRLGAVPVTPLVWLFTSDLEEQINTKANQQLQERTAGARVTLLGVTTDEQFLQFHLTGQ